ncbi:helix-turn-helix domain-containing protein [Microbispora sp. NPDC046973]|uniref:AraC-like ligand-binding domain-containing protein n=1 Tax=Microbispora sp. NPDC046973 TaxID=3155022 RepID=UPI003410CA2E
MRVMDWSTRDLAVRDRFPSWYDAMSETLVCTWLTTEDPARFHASARLADLGGLQFSVMSHNTLQASRPAKLIRKSDPEVFQLHLVLTGGGGIRQAGREATFQAGQLLIIDSSWPYQGWRGADDNQARAVIVQFPRAALSLRSDMVRQLAAAPIPVQHGITGVLAGHLKHLAEHAEGLTPRNAEAVSAVTLDLIAAACADRLETTALLSPESRHQALLSLIHDFIRQRLGDPDLTPETIAAAHQVSVRHLYKIFQKQGVTVAAWIRRCRLERCHRDLADPRQRARPIQAIAARWGFTDAATFSRAFRAAYGMSPRDHRNSAAGTELPVSAPLWS